MSTAVPGNAVERPEQCTQMKKMRRQLYGATPEGQNLIARRMSEHYRDCEQCAEWWDWVSEKGQSHVDEKK